MRNDKPEISVLQFLLKFLFLKYPEKKIENSLNLTLKDFFGLDDERDDGESFAQTHVVG